MDSLARAIFFVMPIKGKEIENQATAGVDSKDYYQGRDEAKEMINVASHPTPSAEVLT